MGSCSATLTAVLRAGRHSERGVLCRRRRRQGAGRAHSQAAGVGLRVGAAAGAGRRLRAPVRARAPMSLSFTGQARVVRFGGNSRLGGCGSRLAFLFSGVLDAAHPWLVQPCNATRCMTASYAFTIAAKQQYAAAQNLCWSNGHTKGWLRLTVVGRAELAGKRRLQPMCRFTVPISLPTRTTRSVPQQFVCGPGACSTP